MTIQRVKTVADEQVGTKFNVTQVAMLADGKRVVKMVPVSDTETIENNALWTGAAKGKAELTVTNNEFSEFFKPGRSYIVHFTEVPMEADPEEQKSEASAKELAGGGKKK